MEEKANILSAGKSQSKLSPKGTMETQRLLLLPLPGQGSGDEQPLCVRKNTRGQVLSGSFRNISVNEI